MTTQEKWRRFVDTLTVWWRLPWRIENRFAAITNQLQMIQEDLVAKATQADLDAFKADIVSTITAEKEEVLAAITALEGQIGSDTGVTTEALTAAVADIKAGVQGIYSAAAPPAPVDPVPAPVEPAQ